MGRFKFANTVNWVPESSAQLWLQPTNSMGSTNTNVIFCTYGTDSLTQIYTTTNPTDGTGLTLTHTQASPFAGVPLNSALATVSNETFSQIVTAYPNPFQDDFRFQINTASNETVQVAIYDLVGKCIELIKVDANQINDLQVGKNYPSGFYSLKVSQGDKTQSVRMIKK